MWLGLACLCRSVCFHPHPTTLSARLYCRPIPNQLSHSPQSPHHHHHTHPLKNFIIVLFLASLEFGCKLFLIAGDMLNWKGNSWQKNTLTFFYVIKTFFRCFFPLVSYIHLSTEICSNTYFTSFSFILLKKICKKKRCCTSPCVYIHYHVFLLPPHHRWWILILERNQLLIYYHAYLMKLVCHLLLT